jgi:CBS domain-containing protein
MLLSGTAGYAPLLALAGAAAFWGAILDVPVASCVLIFELTGEIQAALLCLVASLLAQRVARKISVSLVNQGLEARGLHIVEGRSKEILEHLNVSDAMVTDHETIHEEEPVSQLPERLEASRYPFLPVVDVDQKYTGMVTVDMVQDRLREAHPTPDLARIFEVKDLLYRSGFKTPTLRSTDSLAKTRGLFQDFPCVPVVAENGEVEGLLFVHHVRLAYEKEVARRSLKAAGSDVEFFSKNGRFGAPGSYL